MKTLPITMLLALLPGIMSAGNFPVFTAQPTNQTVLPGSNAALTVAAAGASSFQWQFNGTDISGATNSTLTLTNLQTTNSGYYMSLAKNATGWVPSQMAWLAVVPAASGTVPLSNTNNTYFQGEAMNSAGIEDGTAQVFAGPALDQMQLVGPSVIVTEGYYDNYDEAVPVPTVAPGQIVYYSVYFTSLYGISLYAQTSTVMSLIAGGNDFPIPSVYGLKFPGWPEWPEPTLYPPGAPYLNSPTNQTRVLGENFSFTNSYFAYTDFGIPTAQWRKNGKFIEGAVSFTQVYGDPSWGGGFQGILNCTNVQATDAGIYDLVVYGNNWLVGPKINLSIQVTNGQGVLSSPRIADSNFICDLEGAQGRRYAIESSTNLLSWNTAQILTNTLGSATFTNTFDSIGNHFYRVTLLP